MATTLMLGCILLLSRFFSISWQFHPLRFVETLTQRLADKVHPDVTRPAAQQRLAGSLAWLVLISIPLTLWFGLYLMSAWPLLLDAIVLLLILAWPHYAQQGLKVATALQKQQLSLGKQHARSLLLRECDVLSEMGLVKATLESLALRFNQQFTAVILWYLIAGAPGAIICRLSQIASQQWSIKHPNYSYFGLTAARLSKIFNWPAYMLGAFFCRLQAPWHSATPTQIAAENAFSFEQCCLLSQLSRLLRTSLGGPRSYQQQRKQYPRFQQPYEPVAADILRLLKLLDYQLITYILLLLSCAVTLSLSLN